MTERVIAIHPRTLELRVASRRIRGWICELASDAEKHDGHSEMFELLYGRMVRRSDRRRPRGVWYKIAPPPAWLVALAHLAFQGAIQGMSWDGIKLAISRALPVLRRKKVIPSQVRTITDIDLRLLLGISLTVRRKREVWTGAERRSLSGPWSGRTSSRLKPQSSRRTNRGSRRGR